MKEILAVSCVVKTLYIDKTNPNTDLTGSNI